MSGIDSAVIKFAVAESFYKMELGMQVGYAVQTQDCKGYAAKILSFEGYAVQIQDCKSYLNWTFAV